MSDALDKQLDIFSKIIKNVENKLNPDAIHKIAVRRKSKKKNKRKISRAIFEFKGENPRNKFKSFCAEMATDEKRRKEMLVEECTTSIKKLREDKIKETYDNERMIEIELNSADISRINVCVNQENEKKTLRGRGGGELIIPPSYLNANPKPATPSITQAAQFLLNETEIADDIRAITREVEVIEIPQPQVPIKPGRRVADVQLSKLRLIYDSKPYKQTEEVTVESNTFGKFQARIDQINDNVVIFKATASWDTRQIHASFADLQEGRVLLYKRRAI